MKYVVMERGYEYNDEISYQTEGGYPNHLWDTEEQANRYALEKNIEALKNHGFDGTFYSISELFDMNKINRIQNIVNFEGNYDDSILLEPVTNYTDEQLATVIKAMSSPMFYVESVEYG